MMGDRVMPELLPEIEQFQGVFPKRPIRSRVAVGVRGAGDDGVAAGLVEPPRAVVAGIHRELRHAQPVPPDQVFRGLEQQGADALALQSRVHAKRPDHARPTVAAASEIDPDLALRGAVHVGHEHRLRAGEVRRKRRFDDFPVMRELAVPFQRAQVRGAARTDQWRMMERLKRG